MKRNPPFFIIMTTHEILSALYGVTLIPIAFCFSLFLLQTAQLINVILLIDYLGSTSRRFSAGMAIVNMLLRPISTFFLYKILQERQSTAVNVPAIGGSTTFIAAKNFGTIFAAPGSNPREAYREIPQVAVQNPQEGNDVNRRPMV